MPVTVTSTRNQSAVFLLLRSTEGGVGEFMRKRGKDLLFAAVQEAPRDKTNTVRPAGHRKIRDSHTINGPRQGASGLVVSVVNNAGHAVTQARGHQGFIFARGSGSQLIWRDKNRGLIKNHFVAGHAANPWMERAYNKVAQTDRFTDVVSPMDEQ